MQRVVQQSGLDGLAVGDVLDMRDQVIRPAGGFGHLRGVHRDPEGGPVPARRKRHSWRETCEAPLLSSSAARRAAGRSSGWVRSDSAVPTSAAGSRRARRPAHGCTGQRRRRRPTPLSRPERCRTHCRAPGAGQAARVPLRPGFRARRRKAGCPVRLDHRGRGHQVAAQCPVPAAMVGVRGGKLHVGDIVGALL